VGSPKLACAYGAHISSIAFVVRIANDFSGKIARNLHPKVSTSILKVKFFFFFKKKSFAVLLLLYQGPCNLDVRSYAIWMFDRMQFEQSPSVGYAIRTANYRKYS
jgi:hypothetical protein